MLHRLFGSALLGQLARLAQLIALRLRAAQRLDLGNVRVVGIHPAQTVQGLRRPCRPRPSACSPWPGRPGLQDYWVLRGESAATAERPCPAGRATQAHGLCPVSAAPGSRCRSGRGLLLGEAYLERQQTGNPLQSNRSPSPATNPHRRFHSTFSSPPGPNRNLPSRKPVANRARF